MKETCALTSFYFKLHWEEPFQYISQVWIYLRSAHLNHESTCVVVFPCQLRPLSWWLSSLFLCLLTCVTVPHWGCFWHIQMFLRGFDYFLEEIWCSQVCLLFLAGLWLDKYVPRSCQIHADPLVSYKMRSWVQQVVTQDYSHGYDT